MQISKKVKPLYTMKGYFTKCKIHCEYILQNTKAHMTNPMHTQFCVGVTGSAFWYLLCQIISNTATIQYLQSLQYNASLFHSSVYLFHEIYSQYISQYCNNPIPTVIAIQLQLIPCYEKCAPWVCTFWIIPNTTHYKCLWFGQCFGQWTMFYSLCTMWWLFLFCSLVLTVCCDSNY